MKRLFGTDGVRGTANTVLTPELVLALGKAAGQVLGAHRKNARILIGRDTRRSGEMLQAALTAGLCSTGVNVCSAGVITTPAVAMLTRTQDFAGGAVISASHNAAPENGIKFLGSDGRKLPDALEAEIESRYHARADNSSAVGAEVGRNLENPAIADPYIEMARRTAEVDLRDVYLVMDGANGAGSRINADILESLGIRVHGIHTQPDGMNINADCGSTCPEALCRTVKETGADLGAAFDGDGDRVILCDESGDVVDGDHIMAMCARFWKGTDRLPGDVVVGTVMSNLGLEKSMFESGVRFLRAPVGDRYVAEMMQESCAAVGGEKSGHIIFSRYATTGDGLLTLLQVLNLMGTTGSRLSELAGVMTEYPQILVGVPVFHKDGWDSTESVQAALHQAERRLEGRGRLLVRPSGTENLIRIMAEGPDQSELEELIEPISDAIRSWNVS